MQKDLKRQKYFYDIDKAIDVICFALFPFNPNLLKQTYEVSPLVKTSSHAPHEKTEQLDYEIRIKRHLSLNVLRLWKIAQYNLHFHGGNFEFNRVYGDCGTDFIDNRSEMRNIGEMTFTQCCFDEINIHLCTFKKLIFKHCTFTKSVNFDSCVFEEIIFEHCIFECCVSITNSHFKEISKIHGKFLEQANFSGCIFGEKDDYKSAVFFNQSTFKQTALFTHTRFYGGVASFYKVVFEKTPNFSQAIFQANLNLVNSSLNFDYKTTHKTIQGKSKEDKNTSLSLSMIQNANDFRDSFRIFKHTLSKEGNLLDASNYHRVELYCKEIELDSKLKESWNWRDWIDKWQLRLYRHTSDHHTDLLKIISWVLVAIGCFGVLYLGTRVLQDASIITKLNPYGLALSFTGAILALPFCTTAQKPFFEFRRYLTILSSIATLWIACYKPILIFGAINLIDRSPRLGLENLLLVLYTLAMILLLFSLQKTARKNSIIPS